MSVLTFSDAAKVEIAKLPSDSTLLLAVWRHLERAVENPDQYTVFPPPIPHRRDRRLCAFRAYDTAGNEWAFTVLFAQVGEEMKLTYFAFNRAIDYPEGES